MKTYTVDAEHAMKLRDWIASGRGVAVWQNRDLGSPSVGGYAFTPAITAGARTPSPHWNYGNAPVDVVHSREAFRVRTTAPRESVKVRRGPPYLGGIHRKDRAKLDAALARAGKGSFWTYDSPAEYGSPWFSVRVWTVTGTEAL